MEEVAFRVVAPPLGGAPGQGRFKLATHGQNVCNAAGLSLKIIEVFR
jgi:hypothetical protein